MPDSKEKIPFFLPKARAQRTEGREVGPKRAYEESVSMFPLWMLGRVMNCSSFRSSPPTCGFCHDADFFPRRSVFLGCSIIC
jgi:hypothetical protein